jgi:hypothetical protein
MPNSSSGRQHNAASMQRCRASNRSADGGDDLVQELRRECTRARITLVVQSRQTAMRPLNGTPQQGRSMGFAAKGGLRSSKWVDSAGASARHAGRDRLGGATRGSLSGTCQRLFQRGDCKASVADASRWALPWSRGPAGCGRWRVPAPVVGDAQLPPWRAQLDVPGSRLRWRRRSAGTGRCGTWRHPRG